ncbi:glutamate racemase [Candidatus Vallotia cooleyia]|uniref:glutamate racemase n=1 Tax=Candidatus Vallotiella adelgis TaxID=1177211 RepID=UPI001D012223|nr:glutamate racemase [Candidatus Vallotia cooleyia]UDG82299.1 Glutamate racemase 2 [Candidatus Vallotia cooleyia]
MVRNESPIGIFDSGVGGLSVLRAIRAALPDEALLYFADSRYAPYGKRDNAFITARMLGIVQWLEAQHVKAIVVACNTATVHTVSILRKRFQMPIIGVEPGIKPAALRSRTRVAGVLATASTLKSVRFNTLLTQYGSDCRFICQAGHDLVDDIESGDTDSPVVMRHLLARLQPILYASADTLVLGCTHYPFLLKAVHVLTDQQLKVIDTGEAIARQLMLRLTDQHLLIKPDPPVTQVESIFLPTPLRFVTTGDALQLTRMTWQLLGVNVAAEHVEIASDSG